LQETERLKPLCSACGIPKAINALLEYVILSVYPLQPVSWNVNVHETVGLKPFVSACWIPKAINTLSEYAIFNVFPLQEVI
jgi:hypothetical protein